MLFVSLIEGMLSRKNIYFIGGGGIGMSALIRYFVANGKNVVAYDKTETNLTSKLIAEGTRFFFEDKFASIPPEFQDASKTLVVYTPAIPKDSQLLKHFTENGYSLYKRSEILGFITESNYNIAVAGTHGKTTISSMVAHCLKYCKYPFTAFLGGMAKSIGSNYYNDLDSKVTVIEADEYDRSFLKLSPNIISLSAADADHLDIYGTEEEMHKTFKQFLTQNLQKGGVAIIEKKLEKLFGNSFETYSLTDETATYFVQNLEVEGTKFTADFHFKGNVVNDVILGLPGLHNMENALVTFAIVSKLGIDPIQIKEALHQYAGVERRFDIHIDMKELVYIDDYAHHPEEINKLVSSVLRMYPGKKIIGIFQPHLFTRTRDFLEEFAKSLEPLDAILLLPIYPARELPIEGVNSKLLLDKIKKNSKTLCSKKDIHTYLIHNDCDVVLTMGAGDIGAEVQKVKETLLNKLTVSE